MVMKFLIIIASIIFLNSPGFAVDSLPETDSTSETASSYSASTDDGSGSQGMSNDNSDVSAIDAPVSSSSKNSEKNIDEEEPSSSQSSAQSSTEQQDPDVPPPPERDPTLTDWANGLLDVSMTTNTGAAVTSIPINVPPGRKDIQPEIALQYNSRNSNGWIGMGWSLAMGAIQRNTKHGVEYDFNFDDDDYVVMVNGGSFELTRRSDWDTGTYIAYGAKMEGSFSKYYYESVSGGWIVVTREGIKEYYGTEPITYNSTQVNSNGIFKWMLEKVEDAHGNYMSIFYTDEDQGEVYLERIEYTGNSKTGLSPSNIIHFYKDDGSRTDNAVSYKTLSPVTTAYRLKAIEVIANGQTVRAYTLSYDADYDTPGDQQGYTTGRSLLGKVKQWGSDAIVDTEGSVTGGLALPEIIIEWRDSQFPLGFTFHEDKILPPFIEHNPYSHYVTGDWNGDAITDLMIRESDGENKWYINDGNLNFAKLTSYINWNDLNGKADYFGDWNGDGITDIMCFDKNSGFNKWWVNDGSGAFNEYPVQITMTRGDLHVGDWNGDGITDAMWHYKDDVEQVLYDEWYVLGPGGSVTIYEGIIPYYLEGTLRTGDWNGDGIYEYMWHDEEGRTKWYINDGSLNFSVKDGLYNPHSSIGTPLKDFRFGDWNGDGIEDFMIFDSYDQGQDEYGNGVNHWYINDGNLNFTEYFNVLNPALLMYGNNLMLGDWNGDGATDISIFKASYRDQEKYYVNDRKLNFTEVTYNLQLPDLANTNVLFGDWDGNGVYDFAQLGYVWTIAGFVPVNDWYVNTYQSPDLLSAISNGIGADATLVYTPSSEHNNRSLPYILQTLSSLTVDDGMGNFSNTIYEYSGGYHDRLDRTFWGFDYVKETLPNGTYTETWFNNSDYELKGFPEEQVTKGPDPLSQDPDPPFKTFSKVEYENECRLPCTGPYYSYPVKKTEYECDGLCNETTLEDARISRTDFEYDDYGNMSRHYYHGNVSIVGDEKDEKTDYYLPGEVGEWLISLPKNKYVIDSDGFVASWEWHTYYQDTGDLKALETWLDDGPNPVTMYTYEPSYGNIKTITDPKGYVTEYTYDTASHTYPEIIKNPLNHLVQRQYDERYGKVKQETDPNNNVTTYDFDEFGRLDKITRPDPYGITKYTYNNFGTPTLQNIRKEELDRTETVLIHWAETYFDGRGRTIQERSGGNGGSAIFKDTTYNIQGLKWKESYPYYENDTSYETVFTYDPVERLSQTDYPDGTSTSTFYDRGRVTYIDANTHQKVKTVDVYDRITGIEEYTGDYPDVSLYATTIYDYDALDNLVYVRDALNNETVITYDSLSRKTAIYDPDMGLWEYEYDANGNMVTQIDGFNDSIAFQYDKLNRVTLKDYEDPSATDATYVYDEGFSTNGIGRLTTLTDISGVSKFYYVSQGQVERTDKTVAGDIDPYMTSTLYDELGRVKKITYPNLTELEYSYDDHSRINEIYSGANTYIIYNDYTAAGKPDLITYGNGITTDYDYYPDNNRLKKIVTSKDQNTYMDLEYFYDAEGNIAGITDPLTYLDGKSRTRAFKYDELNRLVEADSESYGGKLLYQYDEIGNITYNCRYGHYFYEDVNHIHAVTRIEKAGVTSASFEYDVNGNMIMEYGYDVNGVRNTDPTRELTYDYDNMPVEIVQNSIVDNVIITTKTTEATYDAYGMRVTKDVDAGTTKYIGKDYECTGGNCTVHVLADIRRIAQIDNSGVHYYHTDHLGSSSVITDRNAGSEQEVYYYPYGEIHTNRLSNTTDYLYTGKEWDSESGLYYYGARYYDPKLARFVSADTIVPKPFYPQSLNRFAYAYNNPIRLIDLDGHEAEDSDDNENNSSESESDESGDQSDDDKRNKDELFVEIGIRFLDVDKWGDILSKFDVYHCFGRYNKSNHDTQSFDKEGVHEDKFPDTANYYSTKGQQTPDCVKSEMNKNSPYDYDVDDYNCCHALSTALYNCGLSPEDKFEWPNTPFNADHPPYTRPSDIPLFPEYYE